MSHMDGTTSQSIQASSDELSSLPDSVLCHILSFLPTKLSVTTSVLAKRWRFLWTNVVNLDFCEFGKAKKSSDHQMMSFTDFVNKVLLLHNVRRLNSFRLIMYPVIIEGDRENDHLDQWIETIISRNVQAIYLALCHPLKVPHRIFTCSTLVELRIHCCVGIVSSVSLPNLKKLRLDNVYYETGSSLSCLISGCPVLEELEIREIIRSNMACSIISSPTIKWLALYLDRYGCDSHRVEINTPALRYLILNDDEASQHISVGTMNYLVEADISLDIDICSTSFFKLVENLCQVTRLRISTGYYNVWDSAIAVVTELRFDNLTKLEWDATDWRFLMKFVQSADNLEILIIKNVDEELKCWIEQEKVPTCLSSRLRQVRIDMYFEDCLEGELCMVSYILKHAKVLKMMDIYAAANEIQRISQMKRASDTCKLAFWEDKYDTK